MRSAAILAATLALPAPALNAEEAPVLVVTGKGLAPPPASAAYASVEIDRDALLEAPRIEEALASVAGFQQFRRSDSRSANPSAQGVTLRALGGNAASRALVLLDGVPMGDPFFGSVPFTALAPDRLESLRVTRGGGTGSFGAGALAGTIELTSADAAALGSTSGSATTSQAGDTSLSAALAGRLGAGFATLSGRWDRGPGFWTTPESQRVAASVRSRYESRSVQLRGVAPLSDEIEMQARLLAFDDHRTLRFRGADSAMEGQDASLRVVGKGRWQFDALAYVQARNFSNVVVSATRFTPVLDQRNTPSTGLGAKLELRPPTGGGHVLRVGMDVRQASGRMFEDALNAVTGAVTERRTAGGRTSDLGLYLEDDWTRGPLLLTAGVRADRSRIAGGVFTTFNPSGSTITATRFPDRTLWSASFRGGALLRASGTLSLRAAGYTGLRLPTLNELYRPFTVFPVTTLANAELGNERLLGYEAGFDWAPSRATSLSLTAFDNRVRDAIANVTIASNLRQRQNIAAIRARGIEAEARARLGQFRFESSLAYSDARAQGGSLDGRRPAQTPRWSGNASLAWQLSTSTSLSLSLRHQGAQYEDDLETDVLPAATTLDAYAAVPLAGRLSLVLSGENLTDAEVVTRNQAGSLDLGAPRTLWIGVRLGA